MRYGSTVTTVLLRATICAPTPLALVRVSVAQRVGFGLDPWSDCPLWLMFCYGFPHSADIGVTATSTAESTCSEVWSDLTELPSVSQPARKVRWNRRRGHNPKCYSFVPSAPCLNRQGTDLSSQAAWRISAFVCASP